MMVEMGHNRKFPLETVNTSSVHVQERLRRRPQCHNTVEMSSITLASGCQSVHNAPHCVCLCAFDIPVCVESF